MNIFKGQMEMGLILYKLDLFQEQGLDSEDYIIVDLNWSIGGGEEEEGINISTPLHL